MSEPIKTKVTDNQAIDYARGFLGPAEALFFTDKENQKIEQDSLKLQNSVQYLESASTNDDIADGLDKAIVEGKVLSLGEITNLQSRKRALEEGMGSRVGVKTSIVHPSGKVVILSDSAASYLRFIGDGYVLVKDAEDLIRQLTQEGISLVKLQKVRDAFEIYGAVIVQLGIYNALKPLLDEALGTSTVTSSFEGARTPEHGASLNALKSMVAAPTPPSAPRPMPPAPPKPTGPAMTSQEIKREISTKELQGSVTPKPMAPPTPPPSPRPAGMASGPAPSNLRKNPTMGLNSLKDIQVVDDLKRIEPAHLRQGFLPDQMKMIRSKISYLSNANRLLPVQVANVFEQSPLFSLYVALGSAIMLASTSQQKADYRQVAADMAAKGQETLTLPEFEAVADLRKDLERM